MASWSIWASSVVVCAGLLAVSGCGGEIEKYPPPKPADVTGPVGGDGSGASTSAGGTSGGGAGGTGSGTTTYPDANMCECAYTYMFDATCGQCVNMNANKDTTCKSFLLQCNIDATCAGFVNCPTYCFQKPDDQKVQCIKDCILPIVDDLSHQLYADFMNCICYECSGPCAALTPITCE